jgi:hypothetical protein
MPAAYQDQNGKWWKECSSTKQLFGAVDTKEELSEWFCKHKRKSDGFNTQCKIVSNQHSKKYNSLNKEKIKEYKRSDKMREWKKHYNKKYLINNKEKVSQSIKIWKINNKEKVVVYQKNYQFGHNANFIVYRKTAKRFYSKYKYSAKKREINFTLTLEWFEEQMTKPEFNVCYFSGVSFVDGINHPFSRSLDRISSTKGYTPDNVRWVCFKLNSWKSDLTLNEVAIMFKAMAQHHNVDPHEVLKKVA